MKILRKTPLLADFSNTPIGSQLLDSPDIKPAENDNINNPIKTHIRNLPNQITPEKQITSLKTEVAVLKEFILEQLYVIKKSVEYLKNKHYQLMFLSRKR